MKKAKQAPTKTGPIKRCGTCSHGSSQFKIIGKTHLHCQHPEEKVAGEPGWGTLRNWFDKGCAEWKSREEAQKTVWEANPHRGSEFCAEYGDPEK
jgi:hypothetical protein